MAIKIAFRDPRTSEIKLVKVGWSWTLFLFAWLFGIPLFMRKLVSWGLLFLAMNFVFMLSQPHLEKPPAAFLWLATGILQIVLIFYISAKGNELTAKGYLARGWQFLEPESDLTKFAKLQWHIFDKSAPISSKQASNVADTTVQP